MSEIYDEIFMNEGRVAFKQGVLCQENPYSSTSQERTLWLMGWLSTSADEKRLSHATIKNRLGLRRK